jgi:uncharacterized protein YaaQ
MKLAIAIVQSADSGRLSDALVAKGFRSTRLSTVGGFLDEPNVTMLIGTEDEQLPELLTLIRTNCRARRRYMNAAPMSVETAGMPLVTASPIEVEVGGATVFITPVRGRFRLGLSGPQIATGLSGPQALLILAIVHPDEIAGVTMTLIKANYRFTRINSVGNFFRKGNTTLLIGVTAGHVDKVLNLMQSTCRGYADPAPAKGKPPSYAVTAFVIDTIPLAALTGQ